MKKGVGPPLAGVSVNKGAHPMQWVRECKTVVGSHGAQGGNEDWKREHHTGLEVVTPTDGDVLFSQHV